MRLAWIERSVRPAAAVPAVALAAVLLAPSDAGAQFMFTNDKVKTQDLIGFKLASPPPSLAAVPNAAALLGTLDTIGRWTVGDLDRDGKPEIALAFTVLAEESRIVIWTFDPAARRARAARPRPPARRARAARPQQAALAVRPEASVAYFDALTAPSKTIVWFERSGHEPFMDEPQKFNQAMREMVRPVVDG